MKLNKKGGVSPILASLMLLIITSMIIILFMAWLFGTLYLDDEEKYQCFLKLPTNETFDDVKIRIFEKDDKCCFEEREYWRSDGFREQGTLSYFIFGSGKGTHTSYVDKCVE